MVLEKAELYGENIVSRHQKIIRSQTIKHIENIFSFYNYQQPFLVYSCAIRLCDMYLD